MSKTTNKRPPQTPKEQRFAREYLATGNATEAAARAYDVKTRHVARSLGAQNLAKLSFAEYFDQLGLDNQKLVESLIEATQATRYTSDKQVPDWNSRLKALELCMRLKGTFQLAEQQNQVAEESQKTEGVELSVTMGNLLTRHFTHRIKKYQDQLKESSGQGKTNYQELQSKVLELFRTIQDLEPRLFEAETT